jgi:hypothetical protein
VSGASEEAVEAATLAFETAHPYDPHAMRKAIGAAHDPALGEDASVCFGDVLKAPLRETLLAVLTTMPRDAAPEHLAAMLESQVRGWLEHLHREGEL